MGAEARPAGRASGNVVKLWPDVPMSRSSEDPAPGGPAGTDPTREERRVRVAEAVGRALVEAGHDRPFGVVGSGNFWLTHAMAEAGARFVAARHECGAVCMADGWARASGRLGVATVHQGPGLTNATTGLAEAAKSRTPLLLLAADTSTGAATSNFRIDQDGLAASVDASVERLHTPESAMADLARARRRALVERRTVAVMVPKDVGLAPAVGDASLSDVDAPAAPAPAGTAVAKVADLLQSAERPAIVAGRGAVAADAGPPLEALADRTGALVATSANGHGLFAGHPRCLGIAGGFASPTAARLLAEADLVLAFGASLNMWTTRHGTLIGPDARVVQVDVEPAAIGRHVRADVGLVADAAEAARTIAGALERRGHEPNRWGREPLEALEERIAGGGWRDVPYEDASTGDTIDPRTLSLALEELLPAERTVAIDSGHFMGWPAMYLSVPDPRAFVFNQSFQSIGLGLGAAIGAAVARPDRITMAALGDGGAFMALGELETAARLSLPLLVVVYDDAAYGAEVHHFAPETDALDIVRFPDADFAALGRAAGGEGITVRSPADLAPVGDWLEDPDGPLVVDARVTPTVVGQWLEDAFRGH